MFSALIVTKAGLRGEVYGCLAQIHAQYMTSPETLPQVQSIEEFFDSHQIRNCHT